MEGWKDGRKERSLRELKTAENRHVCRGGGGGGGGGGVDTWAGHRIG